MLLSAAVNYPCQSWLVRHYGPRPAHSFTLPPPALNPLPQTALVTSFPAPGLWGQLPPAQACFLPALGRRMRSWRGDGRLPDAGGSGVGGNRSPGKTPAQQILGSWLPEWGIPPRQGKGFGVRSSEPQFLHL